MSQSDDMTESEIEDVPARARRRVAHVDVPKWVDRLAKGIVLGAGEVVAVVLGLAVVWFGAMDVLFARGGADVTAFVPNAETWFAEAYEGREADIGALRLVVDAEAGKLGLRGRDITVIGEDAPLASVGRLDADFDMAAALAGRVDLLRLDVEGGALTVRRDAGGWVAGLGTPGNLGKLGPLVDLDGPVGDVAGRIARPPIRLSGATLHLDDQVAGLEARLEKAELSVAGGVGLAGELAGTLFGSAKGVPLEVAVAGNVVEVMAQGLRPSEFAAERGPLARLADIDIALDVKASAIRGEDGVEDVALSVSGADGAVLLDGRNIAVQALDIAGVVNPTRETFDLDITRLATDFVTTSGELSGDWQGGVTGLFALDKLTVETGEQLGRLVIDAPRGKLAWSREANRVALSDAAFGLVGVRFAGDVAVELEGRTATALDIELDMAGQLSPEALLSLWPEEAIGGARRWIERAILAGVIENVSLRANLKSDELRGEPIANEKLRLDFDVRDGVVKYISTMTPMEGAVGRGVLQGNRLDFDLVSGRVGTLTVKSANVEMPRVVPKGGPMIISIRGEGDVPDLLRLIDQPPFGYASRYNLDPTEFAGRGEVDVVIRRPMREVVTVDQVSYQVTGNFRGVSIPFELAGETLRDADIRIEADATKLSLSGPVSFGGWRADMTYLDFLGDDGSVPTRATLSGVVSRDALDGFGIGLRQYFDGDIPVEVRAVSDGLNLINAEIAADLTGVVLSLDPYWGKPYGIASALSANLRRDGTSSVFEDLTITAPGMELRGEIALREDAALERLRLERLAIDEVMDLGLDIVPNADRTRLVADVRGSFLDLSPAVEARLRGSEESGGLPLELAGRFDRLRVAEGYELERAEVMMRSRVEGVEAAEITGTINGARVLATIEGGSEGRELYIELPDASGAAQALFGFGGTTGGATTLSASLPPVGEPGAVIGEVDVDDLTLTRAPFVAQILSLASLTGLGDTLSGQGLSFEDVDMEFAYREGRLSLRRTRASGPALGLTVEGEIDLDARAMDLNGVLVPAYRANSLLQSIPLIGDVFVGKKGEGIFSLSWSVAGPYDAAQVAVNPLSALTPGVLREIFNPQREGLEEAVEGE